MATELQNLTKLLKAIQLTHDAQEKLQEAQVKLDDSSAEDKLEATNEFTICLQEVKRLKEIEEKYRIIIRSDVVGDEDAEFSKEEQSVLTAIKSVKEKTVAKLNLSFKLPQLEKYKRGDNFAKFCDMFLEYVTLGNVAGQNLNEYMKKM